MIRSLHIIAVMSIIMTPMLSGTVSIEDPDGEILNKIGDIQGERRELDVFEDGYRTYINSYLPDVKDSANLKFSIIADEELTLSIGYSDPDRDNSTMEISSLKILGLVEFKDENLNGFFEMEEPVSSLYPLSGSLFRSDFIRGVNNWDGLEFDDDLEYNLEVIGDLEYRKGYELGFSLGWDLGYPEGYKAIENETGFDPHPFMNIPVEYLIFELNYPPITEMREDGVEKEDIMEYYRVLQIGAEAGYRDGYQRGYRTGYNDPSERMTRSEIDERRNASREEDNSSERQKRRESEVPSERWPSGIFEKMDVDYIKDDSGLTEIEMEVHDRREVFSLTCRISNDFIFKDGEFLSPGSMDMDTRIANFPYREEDTRVALITDLQVMSNTDGNITFQESGQTYEESLGFSKGESEIRFVSSVFSGFLSWRENATSDDMEGAVNSEMTDSILGSYGETKRMSFREANGLIITYRGSESINHGFKLGFIEILEQNYYEKLEISEDSPDSMDPNIFLFMGTGGLVLIFVAVSWLARTRR